MRVMLAIARRELGAYFSTPLAAVFLAVFVAAAGALTFYAGGFFEQGQANLTAFFYFHPWLFLVLMPAIGMRLWAEERRTGTIELLMTSPVAVWQTVVGKFLAAWVFSGIALALTFPILVTVNLLGHPDNGVIIASYVGSLLMGGGILALACFISALTGNQVIAFVISVAAGLLFVMAGQEAVLAPLSGHLPDYLVELVRSLSPASHFEALTRGVLQLVDVIYFVSFIALMLFLNCQIIELRRGR